MHVVSDAHSTSANSTYIIEYKVYLEIFGSSYISVINLYIPTVFPLTVQIFYPESLKLPVIACIS